MNLLLCQIIFMVYLKYLIIMGGQGRPLLHKIIQGFKSITTRECFKFGYRIIWQRNYYEHIIRNEKEYFKICEYIKNNPIRYIQKM